MPDVLTPFTENGHPLMPTGGTTGQALVKNSGADYDTAWGSPGGLSGMYGDGSDGAATLDGTATVSWASKSGSTYTLSTDVLATNLTINSGVTLVMAGFRIFCTGTLTNNGTIHSNGLAGLSTGTQGGAGNNNTVNGMGVGGGAGNLAAGTAGTAASSGIGGSGGAGGTGGAAGGGSGGAVSAMAASRRAQFRTLPGIMFLWAQTMTGTYTQFQGGAGGGGGGGDNTTKGGGGGGGGSCVWAAARNFAGTGTFSAQGGAGGTTTTGNTGGGGGGGGGDIILISPNTISVTTNVSGGAGGGSPGTGGATAGTAGSAGNVYTFQFS